MRNILFIFAVCFLPFMMSGQTNKGDVLIGTSTTLTGTTTNLLTGSPNSIGFTFASVKMKDDDGESEPEKFTSINFSPKVGYFLTDRFVLGLTSDVNYLKFKEDDEAFVSFNVGPFARHYFDLAKFKPFIQASVAFGQIRYSSDWKVSTTDYGGGIGAAFFIGEMVSLDVFGGYNHTIAKDKDAGNNEREIVGAFGFGVGLSVFL